MHAKALPGEILTGLSCILTAERQEQTDEWKMHPDVRRRVSSHAY